MGTLTRAPSTAKSLAGFIITWIIYCIIISSTFAQNDFSPCDTQSCWELYIEAETYYQPDFRGVSDKVARKCITLRTYQKCLERLRSRSCTSDLSYQTAKRAGIANMGKHGCEQDGPVYPEGPEQVTPESRQPCSFNKGQAGQTTHSFCSLFGDPHLKTFFGSQQTCTLTGAWPLLDNEFLTVQVSNSLVSESSSATATTKVTVVIKALSANRDATSGTFCGSRSAIFYQAESGSLPTVFEDGQREHGAVSSIKVESIIPGEQVLIYIRYIDTTIYIKQLESQYLNVGIRMPEEVLNDTLTKTGTSRRGSRQLCVDQCPKADRIDFREFVSARSATGGSISKEEAQSICRETGTIDFYFDSCVFDVIMTGQRTFSSASSSAFDDVRQYSSKQPMWSNRTNLDIYNKGSADVVDTNGCNNLAYSITRSTLFVYIMHVLVSM